MNENIIEALKELLGDDEVICVYSLTSDYCNHYCIKSVDSDDIGGALEDTLHRLLEADLDPYFIMGAFIPNDEEMAELEEFDEYVSIDLDYILGGLIDYFDEV